MPFFHRRIVVFRPAAGRNAHSPALPWWGMWRRVGFVRGSDSYIRIRAISKTMVARRCGAGVAVCHIAKLECGGARRCGVVR